MSKSEKYLKNMKNDQKWVPVILKNFFYQSEFLQTFRKVRSYKNIKFDTTHRSGSHPRAELGLDRYFISVFLILKIG